MKKISTQMKKVRKGTPCILVPPGESIPGIGIVCNSYKEVAAILSQLQARITGNEPIYVDPHVISFTVQCGGKFPDESPWKGWHIIKYSDFRSRDDAVFDSLGVPNIHSRSNNTRNVSRNETHQLINLSDISTISTISKPNIEAELVRKVINVYDTIDSNNSECSEESFNEVFDEMLKSIKLNIS